MHKLIDTMSLSGRTAVITGAAGMLGKSFADALAQLGADLWLVDLNERGLQDIANEIATHYDSKIYIHACDLELEQSRMELVEQVLDHGDINILINNAAFVGTTGLDGWNVNFKEQSIETWRRAFEVNLTAAFHLSQLFAESLRSAPGGNIINVASIYGQWGPDWSLYEGLDMSNPAAYAASKGGLIQITKWLAATMAPDVRVNAISPGGIQREQAQLFVDRYSARTPLGRMATEQDFLGALTFLATDLGAYVTGQVVAVDGGWGVC